MQGHVSSLIGKTTDASKKVYSASMYIPNLAIGLTGEVVVSAKELVFALTEVKFELCLWSYCTIWNCFFLVYSAQVFHRISKMFLATNTILFSTIFKELSQNMCFYMYKNNRKLSEQTRGSKTIRIFLSFCHVVK